MLWIEKYKPYNITDLILDKSNKDKILKIANEKNMPNIIIAGVSGIGKTSAITCLAKNLVGKNYNDNVLELYASDERGVKTVQELVEYFCKKKVEYESNHAQHKIVLIDEADNMTKKAQQCVNNLMEQYYQTTRFAFTCNLSSNILEAIQSRCIIIRFMKLPNIDIQPYLVNICKNEHIAYTEKGLEAILSISEGDIRQAINHLQIIYLGYKTIDESVVFDIYDKPHPIDLNNIFMACKSNNFKQAIEYLNTLRQKGYSSLDISISMLVFLKNVKNTNFNEEIKIRFMSEISKTCIIINKGFNTNLQLNGCLAALCKS